MGVIFMGVGTAHLGVIKKNAAGEVVSETPARWDPDPAGGCVAVGLLNPETMEQVGNTDIFGDWDAANYLARALELIHPNRQINVPDLGAVIRAAAKDGFDICDYCADYRCRECIVNDWKGENEDE